MHFIMKSEENSFKKLLVWMNARIIVKKKMQYQNVQYSFIDHVNQITPSLVKKLFNVNDNFKTFDQKRTIH